MNEFEAEVLAINLSFIAIILTFAIGVLFRCIKSLPWIMGTVGAASGMLISWYSGAWNEDLWFPVLFAVIMFIGGVVTVKFVLTLPVVEKYVTRGRRK